MWGKVDCSFFIQIKPTKTVIQRLTRHLFNKVFNRHIISSRYCSRHWRYSQQDTPFVEVHCGGKDSQTHVLISTSGERWKGGSQELVTSCKRMGNFLTHNFG